MISAANTALTIIRNQAIEEQIDIVYDDYIDEMMAGYEQLNYSVWSYDVDAICYGEK